MPAQVKPVSGLVDPIATPGLSPSFSAGPSPAFEVIQSPDTSDVEDFDFNIGPAAKEDEDKPDLPECWGHRGVSAVPFVVPGADEWR